MNRKSKNSGFTLLEVIISVAIMAILVVALGSFMVTGANVNGKIKRSVALSENSRTTLARLEEDIYDTSAFIVADRSENQNEFYLVKRDYPNTGRMSAGTYTITHYELKTDGDGVSRIYYSRNSGRYLTDSAVSGNEKVLCENVNDFKVTFDTFQQTDNGVTKQLVSRVQTELELAKYGKSFKGTQTVALRCETMYFQSFAEAQAKVTQIEEARDKKASET